MSQRPIADGLFTWPSDEPRLIGSRCDDCGTLTFPSQPGCPGCTGTNVRDHLLERRGTLWTWTIQQFPPIAPPYRGDTSPEGFKPYGIGWVQLPGELMVESRLTTADPDALQFGMAVELAVVPFITDDDGDELMTFAFAPAE